MVLPFRFLPETLNISGVEYQIRTDFRLWMALPKLEDLTVLFKSKNPSFCGYFSREAIDKIVDFYHCGEEVDRDSDAVNVMDFDKDANLIYASFLQAYGIDLYDVEPEGLHWYKFRALLQGIPPDTQLSRLIEIRAYDGDDPDYKKLRDKFALPRQLTDAEEESGRRFDEVFR
ncbi:Gp15 family bacteriophage protein [Mogibacterium timidum]